MMNWKLSMITYKEINMPKNCKTSMLSGVEKIMTFQAELDILNRYYKKTVN